MAFLQEPGLLLKYTQICTRKDGVEYVVLEGKWLVDVAGSDLSIIVQTAHRQARATDVLRSATILDRLDDQAAAAIVRHGIRWL